MKNTFHTLGLLSTASILAMAIFFLPFFAVFAASPGSGGDGTVKISNDGGLGEGDEASKEKEDTASEREVLSEIEPNLAERETSLESLIQDINRILKILLALLIGLAVLVIIWNIFIYIINGENEEKRREALKYITFATISLFLMVSIWGLVRILIDTFDIDVTLSIIDKSDILFL